MSSNDLCVLEVAVNGTTTKELNPNVPRTPDEVATDGLRCVEAGASIIHNHTEDSMWGSPSGVHDPAPYIEAWTPILGSDSDVLTYPTMASGGPGIAIAARWGHHEQLAQAGVVSMGLVDPGSVSLGVLGRDGLPIAEDLVFVALVEQAAELISRHGRRVATPTEARQVLEIPIAV
jgi:uncharacterized protein (DUF849 family)